MPVPAGYTTHTCSHADKAAGAANEAELFLRRARPLLSVPVRGRHDTIVVASPHQDNRFSEGEEPVLGRRGFFFSIFHAAVELRCWRSAERTAGRKNEELGLFPRRPRVCLLLMSLTLVIYLNALTGINNLRSSRLPWLVGGGCETDM